jgi:hypothetical protein
MPEGTGPLTASELIGTPDLGGVLEQYFGFDEGTGGKYTQFFDPYDPTAEVYAGEQARSGITGAGLAGAQDVQKMIQGATSAKQKGGFAGTGGSVVPDPLSAINTQYQQQVSKMEAAKEQDIHGLQQDYLSSFYDRLMRVTEAAQILLPDQG